MRHPFLAASVAALAFLAAAPAFAQPHRAAPPPPHAAGPLRPESPEQIGRQIDQLTDAIMSVDIGPVVDAIDPSARARGAPTSLGSLADRRDPYARARMHQDIAATSAGLGVAVREAAAAAPILLQTLAQARRQIQAAARDARARAAYGDAPPEPAGRP
ncbi:MAG TPA: hypothetical protein VH331_14025 [Allosphingosinicella sp.]|jgi:hypothetical protein|nr:hypothetical protein [Allosphingosinicella sp.]